MIIDFNTLPFEKLPNFKGGEGFFEVQMYWDGNMRIMHGKLAPGASIGLHTHEGNCEILFLIHGTATLLEDNQQKVLQAGQCTYCLNGYAHSLINTGSEEVEFYAAVPKQ